MRKMAKRVSSKMFWKDDVGKKKKKKESVRRQSKEEVRKVGWRVERRLTLSSIEGRESALTTERTPYGEEEKAMRPVQLLRNLTKALEAAFHR